MVGLALLLLCLADTWLVTGRSLPLEDVEEAFVIGDLHADLGCAEAWVRRSGLVDLDRWTWSGGEEKVLVFLGDYVDKGVQGRHVLEFVRNLTESFPSNVVAVLGNHDLYLLLDALLRRGAAELMGLPVHSFSYSFTHPEEFLNWIAPEHALANDSTVTLPALFSALQHVYSRRLEGRVFLAPPRGERVAQRGEDLLSGGKYFGGDAALAGRVRARVRQWRGSMAAGLVETGLAEWLASRPVVAFVGDTMVVHGGLPSRLLARLQGGVPQGGSLAAALEKAAAAPLRALRPYAGPASRARNISGSLGQLIEEQELGDAAAVELLHEAVTYRGFHAGHSRGPSSQACKEVEAVLEMLGRGVARQPRRIIVGHTPGDFVRTTCGGRLVCADSSLSRYFRANGNLYCPVASAEGSTSRRSTKADCQSEIPKSCAGEAGVLRKIGERMEFSTVTLHTRSDAMRDADAGTSTAIAEHDVQRRAEFGGGAILLAAVAVVLGAARCMPSPQSTRTPSSELKAE